MPPKQSQSIIHEYSSAYTNLQAGKRALIDVGIDRVLMNRYIIDAASDTGACDDQSVVATVSLEKVEAGDRSEDKVQYCRDELARLVALQEEVNTLQRVARENGINAALLTIVGQAANQSPQDHGASVIRQLNLLLNDDDSSAAAAEKTHANPAPAASTEDAANDEASSDIEPLTTPQQVTRALKEHWRPVLTDALFCLLASFFAIKLVS
ncbi:hypothetical protein AB833_30330 [Chromatiales bacterium (ex Bugula neritina AB1)]|nr:hypothetical protein AB833_30330 [Chromatiales bacterium (ex Bugula neritina AB1)]